LSRSEEQKIFNLKTAGASRWRSWPYRAEEIKMSPNNQSGGSRVPDQPSWGRDLPDVPRSHFQGFSLNRGGAGASE